LTNAVAELTEPGDLLLHVAASTGTYVWETVRADRRILALNVNPVPLTWLHLQLAHPTKSELSTLLTRLGDIPKDDRPFVRYVEDRYRSPCPRCGQPGIAEWFTWDRDKNQLAAKRVRCAHCQGTYEGSATTEDVIQSEYFPAQTGPAYHLALGRAANPDDPGRQRAAELVQLYTPRNLSLLLDVINRLQRLDLPHPMETSLVGLILEALDQGSRLVPASDPSVRPRSLRPPRYYREQNVWFVLEAALEALDRYPEALPARAQSISELLASRKPGFTLSSSSLHNLCQSGYNQRFDALILELQPPDAVFWALSVLWSVWLWRDRVTSPVRSFLSRRRLTWDWYARSLSVGLIQARKLLRPHAYALCTLTENPVAAAKALTQAVQRSEYRLHTWVGDADKGYYVLLQSDGGSTPPVGSPSKVWETTVRKRGEPTSAEHLEVAALMLSGEQAIDNLDTERDTRWLRSETGKWWIEEPNERTRPLADGVEHTVIDRLTAQPTWQRSALIREVYRRFSGVLSPELALVEACLDAYTEVKEPIQTGKVTIRAEDDPQKRKREIQTLKDTLTVLGKRLGYRISLTTLGDVLWIREGGPNYRFRCIATAILTPHLSNPPAADTGQPCLVLPGGRAALVHFKLNRDPRLGQWLKLHRWQFIKFRHLRRMAQEVKHQSDIEVFLGLDPIVEQGQTQIPLPFEPELNRF